MSTKEGKQQQKIIDEQNRLADEMFKQAELIAGKVYSKNTPDYRWLRGMINEYGIESAKAKVQSNKKLCI